MTCANAATGPETFSLTAWVRPAELSEERGITRASEVTLPVIERYQRHQFHHRKVKDGQPLSIHSQRSHLAIRPSAK